MSRKLNRECDQCQKLYYQRPSQAKKYKTGYCSKECYSKAKENPLLECEFCKIKFKSKRKEQRFCSRSCATSGTRGQWSTKKKDGSFRNIQQQRLYILQKNFDFKECMIEECTYNKTFDIHRFIPGKDGGKYEIGNMFAICPNHHAEIHRGLIFVNKNSDFELKITIEVPSVLCAISSDG